MELYSMPQLDKTLPYSDIHYGERTNLPSTSIPVDVEKFSPVSEDILTSSAWSAVIHQPAEDSEPEDLPSTVDMDAIKGSPSTLPSSGPLGWSEGDQGNSGNGGGESESGDDDDDDEEDDDEDENDKEESSSDNESSSPNSDGDDADSESGTAQGSASDSDSESSSKNSFDSDSDSSDSDSSSHSSESSQSSSSPTPKPFPGRESGKHPSSQGQQYSFDGPKPRIGLHKNDKAGDNKTDNNKTASSMRNEGKSEEGRSGVKKEEEKLHRKESKEEGLVHKHDSLGNPVRIKVEVVEDRPDRSKERVKEPPRPSPLRTVRRKDVSSSSKVKSSNDEVSSSRPSVGSVSTLSNAASAKNGKSTDEKKSDRKASMSISSSTTQTSTSTVSSAANDSGSDMELPDQIVSDAIKRIQLDSKGKAAPSTMDLREEDEDDENNDSSDDTDSRQAHYSSSLLQKFVESTERLSGKDSPARVRPSGTNKHSSASSKSHMHKDSARRKHGLPLSGRTVDAPVGPCVRGGPSDLEVYCSVSNVSPDSGIYCVNGSPWHQSSPAHSPQHPPQQLMKARPSPPRGVISQEQKRKHASLKVVPASSIKPSKKTSSHQEHLKDIRVPPIPSIDDSDEDTTTSTLLLPVPIRRGRGRPKKTPPVLEPCIPFNSTPPLKKVHTSDQSGSKSRKQLSKNRKESESSDQSEERCDKTLKYSTHRSRSREVQVTSQGVQCDQSEFPIIVEYVGSKKKKKNQACQSYDVSELKSASVFKASTHHVAKEKEKCHQKLDPLKTVCDRVKKSHNTCTYKQSSKSQSKSSSSHSSKDVGFVRSSSHRKQDSSSSSRNRSSSSSKRRVPSGTEKRKRDSSEAPAARLAAAAAVLLSSSSTTALKPDALSTSTSTQPAMTTSVRPGKPQRHVEKVVSLPRGLHRKHKKHHKHKDRKGQKGHKDSKDHKKRPIRSVLVDPKFHQEVERLISDFQRYCYVARFQQPSRLHEGTRLPAIFRIRKILKKKKGGERSKTSDRDSGPEVENTNPSVTPAARDSRDKGSTGGKRRPKKSAVETPKGQRPEANNEQRLPLKKRHYHMSTAPNLQSGSSSSLDMSLDISSSAEDKKSNNDESPTSSISSKNSAMSVASHGSRGNLPLSTSTSVSKASLPAGVSNPGNGTETSSSTVSCSAKPVLPSVCAVNGSKVPITSACTDKSNVSNGTLTTGKVTILMPATSSGVSASDCQVTEPGIMSKANASASFASVCAKGDPRTNYPVTTSSVTCSNGPPESSLSCSGSFSSPSSARSGGNGSVPVSFPSLSAKPPLLSVESTPMCKPNATTGSSPKVSSTRSMASSSLKAVQVNTSGNASIKSVADSSLTVKTSASSVVDGEASSLSSAHEDSNSSDLNSTSPLLSTNSAASSGIVSDVGTAQTSNSKGNLVNSVAEGKLGRNSYDDAIEACITKYSKDGSSPAVNLASRAVITTPKKRHRMEMQGRPAGGKGKEVDTSVHSTTGNTPNNQHVKKSNSRAVSIQETNQQLVQTKLSPHVPTPQALSPGGSKLPESGIFEPSSSSEHFIVNVSLPATPVKSVIAGLSKLKGSSSSTSCNKPISVQPSECTSAVSPVPDSFSLTCHNLRQKKNIIGAATDASEGILETSPSVEKSLCPPQQEVDEKSNPVLKTESDLKTRVRSKSKTKQTNTLERSPCLLEGEGTGEKTEDNVIVNDTLASSNELKELRVHVEKLTTEVLPSLKEKEKLSKNLKTSNSIPKRRRKCNRTGFPVKRKRKKKESSTDDVKTEEELIDNDATELSSSNEGGQCKKEDKKEQPSMVGKSGSLVPLKEEICDVSNVVKIEQKRDGQTVILKVEECTSNTKDGKDIKQEPSLSSDIKLNSPQSASKVGEASTSGSEDVALPYINRIPNKEKYMYSGFVKRTDVKPNNKVRKPSKAVIRAMRAKFSENLPLPDLPLGKGSKLPLNWSSDESDDDSVDDPYEFTEADLLHPCVENDPLKADHDEKSDLKQDNCDVGVENDSSRKRPKRDMKRTAVISNEDDAVKSKCAKSEKEGNLSTARSKKKSNNSRTRNKRKNESDDMLSSAESRPPRNKKRLRTVQRQEVDSADTDCDESISGEPPVLSSSGVVDTVSEDEGTKNFSKDAKQPRWRKKYLPAGLFSDYFKLDEPRPVGDGKKNLQYRPEDHPNGLLPPPFHCEKLLRQKKVPFQLPYDLWWLHTHNKLPGRDIVPSWNYKKIRTNVYNNVKPSYLHEPQACNCKAPDGGVKGCGDDCINRLVYTECAPSICPLKDQCCNQRIQKHDWAPGLERFMTKEKGWGVRAKLPIKSGEFILEYVGEVVSDREFKERMASIYTQDTHHYCLHLDGGLVIDGHRMGGDGRFVNHSCEPNCEMQKWSVNGLFRMALFALRDIEAHEELGYDYNFALFNAAEGQPCKCGSSQCRGVIGGKSQRVNVLPSSQNGSSSKVSVQDINEKKGSRKNKRKTNRKNDKEQAAENLRQRKRMEAQRMSQLLTLNIRQMSHQQRCFVQQHHCFMLRNLEKVRRVKEKLILATERTETTTKPAQTNVKQSDVFLTQLNALSIPRNVRTRRLAQAEDNPELARNARLACVLRELYNTVVSAKDEKGETLSSPFMTLPNKRKLPRYYVRIREPLDFSTVEQNINSGLYSTLEAFDQDICKILNNNLKYYGRTNSLGIASVRLNKIYLDAKKEAYPQLVDVLGETLPPSFVAEKDTGEEEDVIRCICGLYRDEGMMIQCERCLVWQHCDCVRADSTFEHYLCEVCQPRPVDLEIIMEPQPSQPTEGQTEYLTLLRSDLQIRQGDTVYVLRDITEGEGELQTKVTYKTIKDPKYGDMDIFRIERLWKDEKGDRFAYGHHYLRPHETYHEPTRKFYPNEVMRVPLYEIIPLDLIWARCWVLDPMTYCKGRPIEAVEEHVYICEYRVDKSAHLFYKISKSQCRANLCLKSYAFETFETRLKPVRTYTPHGPVPILKPRARAGQDDASSTKSLQQSSIVAEEEEEVPLARVRDSAIAEKREKQCNRLNGILLRLLGNQQCKQPLDMSYLLDAGRRPRKKPSSLNT